MEVDLQELMAVEYKVITAQTPMFARLEKISEVMELEARAGWQLYEKYDNYKLRLRRNISARENDKNLDFDPYRTHAGVSSIVTYGVTSAAAIVVVLVILNIAGLFG